MITNRFRDISFHDFAGDYRWVSFGFVFARQVSKCYPKELKEFPQQLTDILRQNSTVLDPEMRMVCGNGTCQIYPFSV